MIIGYAVQHTAHKISKLDSNHNPEFSSDWEVSLYIYQCWVQDQFWSRISLVLVLILVLGYVQVYGTLILVTGLISVARGGGGAGGGIAPPPP